MSRPTRQPPRAARTLLRWILPGQVGADIEVDLRLPLQDVLHGGEHVVRIPHAATCGACRGTGAKAGTAPRTCEACQGSGQHVDSRRKEGVFVRQITQCPDCHGAGQFIDAPCPDCSGSGTVARHEELSVRIPKGFEEGMALRSAGSHHAPLRKAIKTMRDTGPASTRKAGQAHVHAL